MKGVRKGLQAEGTAGIQVLWWERNQQYEGLKLSEEENVGDETRETGRGDTRAGLYPESKGKLLKGLKQVTCMTS